MWDMYVLILGLWCVSMVGCVWDGKWNVCDSSVLLLVCSVVMIVLCLYGLKWYV